MEKFKNEHISCGLVGGTIFGKHLTELGSTDGDPGIMADAGDVGEQMWPCLQPVRDSRLRRDMIVGTVLVIHFWSGATRRRRSGCGQR